MKQISTSLTSKLKQDKIIERDYIIFKGETTRHYLWFNLYDDCYKDGNFIGTFVMKRIEITYNDSDLEFKNKEFNAYKEYKLDNETWESINYGTFVVTNVDPSDTKEEITVTAYDYALKFANTYKTDLDYASGKVTLFQVLQEVCQKVGVELENTSIDNGNFIVDSNQFGENTLYGNVITAIAQISCNFAKITPENKLKLLFKNETNITIETKDYEEFDDKRDTLPYTAVSLGMSNVEGENVSLVAPGVDPDNAKYLTINDNPFAYTQDKRTQLIQAIFDKINGFGYSSFVLSNCLYPQLECGDLVKIRNKDGQLVDSIVLRPTFEETVLNFEAPSTITSSVTYVQPVDAIEIAKRTEIIVNKQEQTIQAVVSEVGQYDERITNVEQSVEGLTTQVSEIANLIRETSGNNNLIIEDASANELKSLSIKGQISLLFGNDGKTYGIVPLAEILYPSSTLFGKNMNLIVEGTEETQTIKLPFTFLNYINSEVCDEFLLQDGKASVVRRVGINSNMEKYELEQEVIEDLGEVNITLFDSYNKIYLQCFDNAILNASYMVKNEYTDEFATKVELNSSITQTKDEINLEVSKKVDENEVISAINLTNEEAKINAQKITLEGIVTANENFKVLEDGSIEAVNGKFSGNIYLDDGNLVIGGDGLLTNLKFTSTGVYDGKSFVGFRFDTEGGSMNFYKTGIALNFIIPDNFTVANAYVTLAHSRVNFFQMGGGEVIGYCRNVKLYKTNGNHSAKIYSTAHATSGYTQVGQLSGNEIPSAFGANGYTASNSNSDTTEIVRSIDIKNYISTGNNTLFINTTDSTSSTQMNTADANSKTGAIQMTVDIIGYTSFENTNTQIKESDINE